MFGLNTNNACFPAWLQIQLKEIVKDLIYSTFVRKYGNVCTWELSLHARMEIQWGGGPISFIA